MSQVLEAIYDQIWCIYLYYLDKYVHYRYTSYVAYVHVWYRKHNIGKSNFTVKNLYIL